MAQVALFLAGDRAGFVNGQEIIVDGGFGHMLMSLVPPPDSSRETDG
jgi:NAD(P)-dependent dehydrogenase (short-subunit alcohol dehydrogenase family)